MKKLIIIIFLLPFIAFGQRYITGDTLVIYGGGSFGGEVKLINSIKVDSILTTIIDSDGALITAGAVVDYVNNITPDSINFKVDATNISQVQFIVGNDTIKESFDHMHNEYALKTNNNVDGLWEVDGTETQLIIADAIDMQTMPIINMDDPKANQDAATKKYVDDSYEIYINKDVISLTAGQVATLGTVPVELIAAAPTHFFTNVLNASVKITPTTRLNVGGQELFILYHGGQEVFKLHEAGIATVAEARWIFITSSNTEVSKETAIDLQLSSGANPLSGAATMEVTIYYTLETY